VDVDSGLVYSVIGTAANVHDVTQVSALLHGEESMAFGDAGYQAVEKRPEATDVSWQVAMRPGKRRALDKNSPWGSLLNQAEQLKASVRAKVEHPFRVLKGQFGFTKVRYKGRIKSAAQRITLFALSSLWMVRKRLIQGVLG
jgi:IS5 family transposase